MPNVRYFLELGRTLNSSGDKNSARDLFIKAWELANLHCIEGLAVDAAHMEAITLTGTREAVGWNERGLALARNSTNIKARALIPAMLNNSAWDLFELGDYSSALAYFEQARAAWISLNRPERTLVAEWSVARCLRSLGRLDEALEMQLMLARTYEAAGTPKPNVWEEIVEILTALGLPSEAQSYSEKLRDLTATNNSSLKD